MNTCKVDGCETHVRSRGMCALHYQRFMRTGSTERASGRHGRPVGSYKYQDRTCKVPGCDSPFYSLGYCMKHRQRFIRHGDPSVVHTSGRKPIHEQD